MINNFLVAKSSDLTVDKKAKGSVPVELFYLFIYLKLNEGFHAEFQ